MHSPQVSIIVPVYKTGDVLHKCVDSILSQSFTDFELLLVDDGSPDECGEICDDYSVIDSRIRVFHKENGGASSARNLGLEHAVGTWVTFCDSDDWVYECWLQQFMDFADENVDLIVQGFDVDGYPLRHYGMDFQGPANEGFDLLLSNNPMAGGLWIKAFRKSIIDKYHIRMNENLSFCEDLLFVAEYVSRADRMISVETSGYYYYEPDWYGKYRDNLAYLKSESSELKRSIAEGNASYFNFLVPLVMNLFLQTFVEGNYTDESLVQMQEISRLFYSQDSIHCSERRFNFIRWLLLLDVWLLITPVILSIVMWFSTHVSFIHKRPQKSL